MSNETLFPVEILYLTGPALPKLSADAARTARNTKLIAQGIHPATGARILADGMGMTCGDCANHKVSGWSARSHHKCTEHQRGMTHGPASDIRVRWPACELFDARDAS